MGDRLRVERFRRVPGMAVCSDEYTAPVARRTAGRLLALAVVYGCSSAAAAGFVLPDAYCPMAHCDPLMTDNAHVMPPSGVVDIAWIDPRQVGAWTGLGCSSNGEIVACASFGTFDTLIVYDYDGNRLWTSRRRLNNATFSSAPMVAVNGDVIACDSAKIIRFDAAGRIVWRTFYPEFTLPISPVPTAGGDIVLATLGGPIYAFDGETGELLAETLIRDGPDDPGHFVTKNTPAVVGNRIYMVMSHEVDGEADTHRGWLVALDLNRAAIIPANRLKKAWHFQFGGPSGGSPLVMGNLIIFDGNRGDDISLGSLADPHIHGVLDFGRVGVELWRVSTVGFSTASPALDPRGGFWTHALDGRWLLRRNPMTGEVIGFLNVDALVGAPGIHVPTSPMTIAGTDTEPVMIISATSFPEDTSVEPASSYVLAIDLASRSLMWKVEVAQDDVNFPSGQFPIVTRPGAPPRIVFNNRFDGVTALGTVAGLGRTADE